VRGKRKDKKEEIERDDRYTEKDRERWGREK